MYHFDERFKKVFFFSNMAFGERLVLKKYVCINICIIIIIIYRFLSGGSEDDLTNFSLEKSNENSFLGELYKLKLNAFVSFRTMWREIFQFIRIQHFINIWKAVAETGFLMTCIMLICIGTF